MKEADRDLLAALNELPDYIDYIRNSKELDPEYSEIEAAKVYALVNSPFAEIEPENNGEETDL